MKTHFISFDNKHPVDIIQEGIIPLSKGDYFIYKGMEYHVMHCTYDIDKELFIVRLRI